MAFIPHCACRTSSNRALLETEFLHVYGLKFAFLCPISSGCTVDDTITFCQPCLQALCPSCALPASLQGFSLQTLTSWLHLPELEMKSLTSPKGHCRKKSSQGIGLFAPSSLVENSADSCHNPSCQEVTKQGLNSGNSYNFIISKVLKTFNLLLKVFWKANQSNIE